MTKYEMRKIKMVKKYVVFLVLFLMSGCVNVGQEVSASHERKIELGIAASDSTWIFLCGLASDFDNEYVQRDRNIIDRIAKKHGIGVVAIVPNDRCPTFNNMLCWSQDTKKDVLATYNYILDVVGDRKIAGFIGFSNGGFFLHKLAHYKQLNVPIVSIGAAGWVADMGIPNTIHLIIGKKDLGTYKYAKSFYERTQDLALTVNLIEHDGGHEIPEDVLADVLAKVIEK